MRRQMKPDETAHRKGTVVETKRFVGLSTWGIEPLGF